MSSISYQDLDHQTAIIKLIMSHHVSLAQNKSCVFIINLSGQKKYAKNNNHDYHCMIKKATRKQF